MASTQRKTVEVTQQHIERAVECDSGYCALSEAIKDAMPHAVRVNSDLQTIRFTDRRTGKRYIFLTPPRCQEYLLMLDEGLRAQMKAFKFLLNRPTQIINPGPSRAKKATTTKTKTHAPIKRDGKAPPVGPLAGKTMGGVQPDDLRIGRIRRFGLRSMGKSRIEG